MGNKKGKSYLDSGYVFAPYVPMSMSPTIWTPESVKKLTPENINLFIAMHLVVDSISIWNWHRVGNPYLRKSTVDVFSDYNAPHLNWYNRQYSKSIRQTLSYLKGREGNVV